MDPDVEEMILEEEEPAPARADRGAGVARWMDESSESDHDAHAFRGCTRHVVVRSITEWRRTHG